MKKVLFFFTVLHFISNYTIFSQQVWLKSYSGSENTIFNSFTLTSDGGSVATGYVSMTTSPTLCEEGESEWDMAIVKLNAEGGIIWQKTYGDTNNDYGYAIIESTYGGYLAVGETTSFGASPSDAFIVRVDSGGEVLWAKRIGGSAEDWAVDVKETDKGTYIVLGVTKIGEAEDATYGYDIFLCGIDEYGNFLWQKQYDGGANDVAYSLLKTGEGDFVIGGASNSKGLGDYDSFLIKTDAGGVIKWQKFFGTNNDDFGYYVTESKSGGFLLVGETFLKDKDNRIGYSNVYVAKIDSFGGDEWQKSYGSGKTNYALCAKPAGKYGFVISGTSQETTGSYSAWAFKINSAGKIIWKRGYDFSGDEVVYSAKPSKDGFLTVLGKVNSGTNTYSFIGKGDKEGKIGSCSYVTDSSIAKKKGSFGSGNLSLLQSTGALTFKGLKDSIKVYQSDISEETLCH